MGFVRRMEASHPGVGLRWMRVLTRNSGTMGGRGDLLCHATTVRCYCVLFLIYDIVLYPLTHCSLWSLWTSIFNSLFFSVCDPLAQGGKKSLVQYYSLSRTRFLILVMHGVHGLFQSPHTSPQTHMEILWTANTLLSTIKGQDLSIIYTI